MKRKSVFSTFASLALAAVVVFASGACSAVTIIKPSSVSKTSKNSITVKWKKKSGSKGYTVLRAHEKKDIRYAQVVGEYPKSYSKMIDKTAPLGYKCYYWVIPKVNANNNFWSEVSGSQSKKCGIGYRSFQVNFLPTAGTYPKGKRLAVTATINGKALGNVKIKWSVSTKGVCKWNKSVSGKRLGYLTGAKKGTGYYCFKVGATAFAKSNWIKIVWN